MKKILTIYATLATLCMIIPQASGHEVKETPSHEHENKQVTTNLSVSLENNTLCDTLQECQELAEEGNAQAQEILAIFYLEGKETPVNKILAKFWLEKALENGATNPAILFILGDLYLNGTGEQQDIEKGVTLTTKAATLGSLQAQLYVWKAFFFGKSGFPQDYDQATKYLEQLKRDYPETNKTKKIDVFLCMTKKKTTASTELKSCIVEVGAN